MAGQTGSRSAHDQRAVSAASASHLRTESGRPNSPEKASSQLYTPDQRARRDATPWTLVQGILAPVQFLVFLISLVLVIRYLVTGEGFALATWSVVIKTLVLYTIMVTGAIWEKVVFGRYLFAPSFFWEDVFSMLVLALHTAYLAAVFFNLLDAEGQMLLALAAYVTYVINAAQFVWKLRQARLQGAVSSTTPSPYSMGAAS
ncbi:2-vinyl bacteriochlorophyllide hydratase [Ahrensia marina]|uniref:2-vinyl bacteriochlorophyllide hydratase n=1 Tax=Ahrensia marina TaxID=1514904 RepID=UPI0035CE8C31